MPCRACAAPLEPDAAFCGVCGQRVRARSGTLRGEVLHGRYHVVRKIAVGGFGSIYEATHLESGASIALKVLRGPLARDPALIARFRREAAALACLRDRHTVATYESGEAPDGTLYIAMELLRGESLQERLATQGALPWRDVLGVMRQVCSSLGEAHARGIVHRDLKPANLHLGEDGVIRVLDFGAAKFLVGGASDDGAELTGVGQTIGTLDYMTPEQLVGTESDPRSDLYQLGVIAYELLTRRRPFADATGPTSLFTALLTQRPAPPSTLALAVTPPADVDALVLRCLEREPVARFQAVTELVAAIDAVLVAHPAAVTAVIDASVDDEPTEIGEMPPPTEPAPT